MRTRPWCVVVALACAHATATAQTVLSEADALSRLSQDSPRVRAIRSAADVARAEVLGAGRWPNPRVGVDREAAAGVSETMTTVLQPLPITGRRAFERAAASALAGAAASRADEGYRRARADLRHAYAELSTAQLRERELSQARDHLQELVDILAKREAAGDAAGFDRLRAERELVDVDADRFAAVADRARAQGALAGFFSEAIEPGALVAADAPPARPILPDASALLERARQIRGESVALEQEQESARLLGRAADRRRVPEPELLAGTKASTAAGGDLGSVIAVQAVVPLFDRGRPERAVAEARARQAQARLDAFQLELRSQIGTLRAAAIARRDAADRYRAAAKGADEIERIARVSYEAGERGILELLDAYRTGVAARLHAAEHDAAARAAEIELEFVSGWEVR